MPQRPQTILLTGFGPFPGVPENISAVLVERLAAAAKRRFPRRRIVADVLATDWAAAPKQLAQLYAREQPFLALHFGVSERARGFVIETRAQNKCKSAPDATGVLPRSGCISETEPDALGVSLPAESILTRLRALSIPAQLSDDAGSYLCNAVLFHALCLAETGSEPCATGFIHIPVLIPERRTARTLDWDTAMAGGIEILRVCLGLAAVTRRD
jgi:pyroglutamyl-peptidase